MRTPRLRWKKRIQLIAGIIIFSSFFVISLAPVRAETMSAAATQLELEQQLQEIEKQIAEYQRQLTITTSQKKTLTNAINQLKIKQKELNALIKKTSLQIDVLASTITVAQTDLEKATAKENRLNEQMATIIRMIHEKESRPLFILVLSTSLSSAFREIQIYSELVKQLNNVNNQVKALKVQIADKKATLEDQKQDAEELVRIKSAQTQALAGSIKEQNVLLVETKGLETNYQTALSDSKKRATEIRGRIYELFNTGTQVNFGQAVDIAEFASKATGVRAAYLLAILTQESNLGKNVGTCNRTGDPPEKSWKVIMKPDRDQDPFVEITQALGLNTDTTPVSCPMRDKNGKQIGWGGAMGPAQFIPSTWMGYKDKVSALTGKTPANPWDIRDAFLASGIKLRDGGAANGEDGEWRAAMIYFAGSVKLQFRFYGDNVAALAKKYQADIDQLKQ